MKLPFLPFLFATLALPSLCPAQENANDPATIAGKGMEKWKSIRETNGRHYRYTMAFSSFTGAGHQTTITVKDGKVVERSYKEFGPPPPAPPPPGAGLPEGVNWTETGGDIGSHKEGASALTLDEIYAKVPGLLAHEPREGERYMARLNADGLLTALFWIDTRIADDAPINGINISRIELLP